MKYKRTSVLIFALLLTLAIFPGQAQPAYPLLSLGSAGDAVTKAQHRLIQAGFLIGRADGVFGEATHRAVLSFQQALFAKGYRLIADGIAGPVTLALLYDDEVMRPFIDISLGTSGLRVTALQNRLIDLKFLDGPADGVFGQKTLEALGSFQRHLVSYGAEGVSVSGAADKATGDWLDTDADLSPYSIRAPEFFNEAYPLGLSDEFLNAFSCILVDAQGGEILYAKNADERMYPASTTKIMTLLLAVEHGGLDERVTVPSSAAEVPKDSSLVPVYPGETMSMRDLLHGLMLRSGNDATNAVAEITAGSVAKFVLRMNLKARQMGLTDTQFTNPHGYHDPEHYTTARDMATLTMYAMQNPMVVEIAGTLEYRLSPTNKRGELILHSGSELLNPLAPAYYPGAYGIKSGYTSAAGFCYVGAARRGSTTLYAVILNSRTRSRGWDDMARLFSYGFALRGN